VTIHTTPLYGIAYADTDTALADYPTVTQQAATTVDAALAAGGVVPPGAADLTAEASTRASADAALSTRVTALETATPPAWTAPALNSGWSNLTPTTTYHPFRYRKVGDVLELSGTLAGAAAGVFVTLPAGYRPLKTVQLACASGSTAVVQVDVNADGTINQRAANTTGFLSFAHRVPLS
jgi:hypothetical protein